MNIAIPELQFFSLPYLKEKTGHTWNVHIVRLSLPTMVLNGEIQAFAVAIFDPGTILVIFLSLTGNEGCATSR
jgi:hypothetical protein